MKGIETKTIASLPNLTIFQTLISGKYKKLTLILGKVFSIFSASSYSKHSTMIDDFPALRM